MASAIFGGGCRLFYRRRLPRQINKIYILSFIYVFQRIPFHGGTLIDSIETTDCLSLIPEKGLQLFSYQLTLVIEEKMRDEFTNALRFLSSGIRNEKGCLDFRLCSYLDKKDTYCVLGEWKTRQAMETHFSRENFSVLIGAAMVLGKDFEMRIGETLEKGAYQFAKKKIVLHQGKGSIQDTKAQTAPETRKGPAAGMA